MSSSYWIKQTQQALVSTTSLSFNFVLFLGCWLLPACSSQHSSLPLTVCFSFEVFWTFLDPLVLFLTCFASLSATFLALSSPSASFFFHFVLISQFFAGAFSLQFPISSLLLFSSRRRIESALVNTLVTLQTKVRLDFLGRNCRFH